MQLLSHYITVTSQWARWHLKSPASRLFTQLFIQAQIKKQTPKLRVTGICAGNSPVIGEFPAQRTSNAENVSIWRRHHEVTPSEKVEYSSYYFGAPIDVLGEVHVSRNKNDNAINIGMAFMTWAGMYLCLTYGDLISSFLEFLVTLLV